MPEAWDTGMQLDMVLRLGVSPDRIVFANACKRPRDIRAAAAKQVKPLPVSQDHATLLSLRDHGYCKTSEYVPCSLLVIGL